MNFYPRELPTLILDVRSKQDYCHGHLPGAILVETDAVPQTKPEFDDLRLRLFKIVKDLPKNMPIYVYCKLGYRANIAVQILRQELGYVNVHWLGGIMTEPLKSELFVKGRIARC